MNDVDLAQRSTYGHSSDSSSEVGGGISTGGLEGPLKDGGRRLWMTPIDCRPPLAPKNGPVTDFEAHSRYQEQLLEMA